MLLLPLLGFVFVSLLVAGAAMALAPQGAGVIERRLEEMGGVAATVKESGANFKSLINALKTLGARAPRSVSEMGKLQQRLVTAGYRSNEAVPVFLGIRIGFALLMFLMFGSPIAIKPN